MLVVIKQKRFIFSTIIFVSSFVLFLSIFSITSAATYNYVVDNLGDAGDANAGDGICATGGAVCTLRAAIEESNADGGSTDILFDATLWAGGPATITPGSAFWIAPDGNTIIRGPGHLDIGQGVENLIVDLDDVGNLWMAATNGPTLEISGMTIINAPNSCLDLNSSNVTISYNAISNCGDHGISVSSDEAFIRENILIDNNTILNDGEDNMAIVVYGSDFDGVTITDNTITSSGSLTSISLGAGWDSQNLTINGNIITGGGSGIAGSSPWSGDISVTNNNITNCGSTCIHFNIWQDFSSYDISDNNITGTLDEVYTGGIELYLGYWEGGTLDNAVIDNNTITLNEASVGVSILCDAGAENIPTASGLVISDNTISAGNQGIHIETVDSATFSGNTISNAENAIGLFNSDSNIISANTISNSSQYGIQVWGDSNNNTFTSNTISTSTLAGIFLTNAATGNTFTGTTLANNPIAIYFNSSGTTGNTVTEATITGATKDFQQDSTDAGDTNYIDNIDFTTYFVSTGVVDVNYDATVTVTSGGNPLEGATVTATDALLAETAMGTTNASGQVTTSIDAYQIAGGDNIINDKNDYTFLADYLGWSASEVVTVDSQDQQVDIAIYINYPPVLLANIPDQEWDEDEDLESAFDLDNYFYDANGDSLTYTIIDQPDDIDVTIGAGNTVSFSQDDNYCIEDTVAFRATDAYSATVDSNSVALTVNCFNDAPSAVTSGFSPTGGVGVNTLTPHLEWDHAIDIDDESSSLKYNVRIGIDSGPENNYDYSYTTSLGTNSYDIGDSLTDETVYYWTVQTEDDDGVTSAWSSTQSMYINSSYDPILVVVLDVGIEEHELAVVVDNSSEMSFFKFLTPKAFAGSGVIVFQGPSWLERIIQPFVKDKIITLCFLGVLLLSFVFAQIAARDPKKIFNMFFKSTNRAFVDVSETDRKGTYNNSYHQFKKQHKITRGSFYLSLSVLLISLFSLGIFSYFLVELSSLEAYALGDNYEQVAPKDILTYRVIFENQGDGVASNMLVNVTIPNGTTSESGLETITFNPGNLDPGESGYVEYTVTVNNPNGLESINNVATYQADEIEEESTNFITNPIIYSSITGQVTLNGDGEIDLGVSLMEDETTILITLTNANGQYTFENLGSGNYSVEADDEELTDYESENNPLSVDLNRGQDLTGQDIEFASVTISETNQNLNINTNTNENINLNQSQASNENTNTYTSPVNENQNENQNVNENQNKNEKFNINRNTNRILGGEGLDEEIIIKVKDLDINVIIDKERIDTTNELPVIHQEPDENFILKGFSIPGHKVVVTIILDNGDQIQVEAIVDENGEWKIEIDKGEISSGEHSIYLQTEIDGKLSGMVEFAKVLVGGGKYSIVNMIIIISIIAVPLILLVLYLFFSRKRSNKVIIDKSK